MNDEHDNRRFASSPCFAHELDAVSGEPVDPQQRADVARWRKAERERQLELRRGLDRAALRDASARIGAQIEAVIGDVEGRTIAGYWPIRREPDLRALLERLAQRGARIALPVVVERSAPLVFRAWQPGEALEPGVWRIPVPAGGDEVRPDVALAPVVAFDRACYRLGNGGGYFDRTLATLQPKPYVLGVGYAHARVPTIYPQPHDVPMDAIVTEDGILEPQP